MWNERRQVNIAWRRVYDYLSLELGITLDTGFEADVSNAPAAYLKAALDL